MVFGDILLDFGGLNIRLVRFFSGRLHERKNDFNGNIDLRTKGTDLVIGHSKESKGIVLVFSEENGYCI